MANFSVSRFLSMFMTSSFFIASIKRHTLIGQVHLIQKKISKTGQMTHTLTTFIPLLSVIFQIYVLG